MNDMAEAHGWTIGDQIAKSVRRVREEQRIPYTELSSRLERIGRPIPVLGLRRIERGERRVDMEELLALAHALSVPPAVLAFPIGERDTVEVVGGVEIHPDLALQWFLGEELPVTSSREIHPGVDHVRFGRAALPVLLYREFRAASLALAEADSYVRAAEYSHGPGAAEVAAARAAYVKTLDDYAQTLYRMVLADVRPPAVARSLLDEMVRLGLNIRQPGHRDERDLTKCVEPMAE